MQKFKFSDGNEIPALGFGTWRLKDDECRASVQKALEIGYRHIDTAEHYGNQIEIGKAISEGGIDRQDLFITSKIFFDRLQKRNLLEDANRALEELQTDYLDLLLVHWPNKNIPISETVEGFNQLKQSGKVKSVGVSNFTPHHIQDFLDAGMQIVNNQVELHPSFNQNSLHEFCKEKNIILTAYSPIAQGQDLDIPEVVEISKKYGVSPAQVIINWIISRGIVAIPRSSKPERIQDNFNSLNWQMEKSDIDSTASGGTTGNLLRLRNQTTDRFVVDYLGGVKIGGNGTNTSVTKYGNTVGDEFFIGTNGAFRVQRSATDSEAFRTQVLGDTQGRWLGTADGKLKFGDGSSAQDVVMQRTGVGLMQLDADYEIVSQDVNNDVLTLTASDGSRLGRFTETSGGHGWFEIDNSSGNAVILFRADGGNSYINSGNFGLGTTSAGTSANKVLAIGNGTAPTTSIADGIQLWAEDVASSSELRVRDEAGNISTLSPHNFSLIPGGASEDMAWSFYSENGQYAINADITKALRLVEGISGQQLVYIKDLDSGNVVDQTARTYASNFKQVESQDLNKQLTAKLGDYVTKQELASNFDFAEKVINVLKEIAIKTKAIFEGSVEFLASAVFHGPITVNADTSGIVYVPAYTKVYKLTFENSFSQKPIVYVTAEDSALNFNVIEVTQSGFEVQINNPSENAMQFQWLALMSENNNPNIEVLEKINSAAIVEPVEFLEPIIVQTPLPSMVPDSATDSSELSN